VLKRFILKSTTHSLTTPATRMIGRALGSGSIGAGGGSESGSGGDSDAITGESG
jgi:hypothetical protein